MIQKPALQMVLTVPESVSASRPGALRLGSLLGPTTTALHVSHLTFQWRSQDLRRQTTHSTNVKQRLHTGATGHDEGNARLIRSLHSGTRAPSLRMRNWIVSSVAQAHGVVLHTSRRRVARSPEAAEGKNKRT
jgi:hypothetical protein